MARWIVALVFVAGMLNAQTVPEPAGFRQNAYRAPVPATLAGARVVSADEAHALWQAGAAFVDVLPQAPKPANLPAGTIWQERKRQSIPGAIWLPNVGFGGLADVTADYFQRGLAAASKGNTEAEIVIFCLQDCWMSWNAAKRALGWGYTNVIWYPAGTDGWAAAGHQLEEVKPMEPRPPAS